uniref:N-acetylgalactosaminide beta-1,3-galactosyltransferase n=1 Tax=Ditylum brightwellii TaxID=49249 RepID=A0A7S4RPB1_9STRA
MHTDSTIRRKGGSSTNGTSKSPKRNRPTDGTSRRKKKGERKGGNDSAAFILGCAFIVAFIMFGVWIVVLLGFEPDAAAPMDEEAAREVAAVEKVRPKTEEKIKSTNQYLMKKNKLTIAAQEAAKTKKEAPIEITDGKRQSWEGWQPHTPSTMEVPWRKCIQKPNTYSSCRDLEADMGTAPPAPKNWVPDVTMLRRMYLKGKDENGNAWPPSLSDELCEKIGPNGGTREDTNKDLIELVPIQAQPLDRTEEQARKEGLTNGKVPPPDRRMPKIMCSLYTMSSSHASTIRAIRETWAGGCDGFLAFSTESDPRIPAISIPHDGPEEYNNMWQKIRSIWRFVGTHYIDEFDFFFIGGDDLFVLPQNLREYLWVLGDPEEDWFVGRRFKPRPGGEFNSGGAGYALSRSTLRKFLSQMEEERCKATQHTAMEDVMIARCLENMHGITYHDTRDDENRERFHPFAPGLHYVWHPPKEGQPADWYEQYNKEWGVLLGKDCCAPDSVSFHYIKKPAMVRHISSLLYQCGKKGNLRGQ